MTNKPYTNIKHPCGCFEQLLDSDGCGTTAYGLCEKHQELQDQNLNHRVLPGGEMVEMNIKFDNGLLDEPDIQYGYGTKYTLSLTVFGKGDADSDGAIDKVYNLLGDSLNCCHKLEVIDTTPIRYDTFNSDEGAC